MRRRIRRELARTRPELTNFVAHPRRPLPSSLMANSLKLAPLWPQPRAILLDLYVGAEYRNGNFPILSPLPLPPPFLSFKFTDGERSGARSKTRETKASCARVRARAED